ncbi:MAG: hypothetical protein JNL92_13790 [Opitutaceae bacterium]|nr:hypothetical protein [Opitutaceae bacterium]
MNQKPDPEHAWARLVNQARQDVGPAIDRAALSRALAAAPPALQTTWGAEFAALFASGRMLASCLAGACAVAILASWQAWETWQALPWIQWVATATGGVP